MVWSKVKSVVAATAAAIAVSLASQKPKSLIWNDKYRYTNNDNDDADDGSICDEIQMNDFFEIIFFKCCLSEGQFIVENSFLCVQVCTCVDRSEKT